MRWTIVSVVAKAAITLLYMPLVTVALFGQSIGQQRTAAEKLGDFVNVKDFGAKCDGGKTDDRAAIQAAIDAVKKGTIYFPDTACGVSAPGIFLFPPNGGMNVIGLGQIPSGGYHPGAGGGLVAFAASPPQTLLTVFAAHVHLRNLYLDCNNSATAHGIVSVMGAFNTWTNVTTRMCSGAGGQIFNEGTPATKLVAGVSPGDSSVKVASLTNQRLTFGEYYCPEAVLDYGTSNVEYDVRISRVAASDAVFFSSGLKRAHSAGATIQCHGNSNDMHIEHYTSISDKGWGWRVIPGSDNNAIFWSDGASSDNGLGGESWSGNMHIHSGGNYQGDRGPAIQLGDAEGATTHFMTIGPIGDLEESAGRYNAVTAVCDDSSQVQVQSRDRLIIQRGGAACPKYKNGSTTTGFGTDGNMELFVKNAAGAVTIRPGENSAGGQGLISFYNSEGILTNTLNPSGEPVPSGTRNAVTAGALPKTCEGGEVRYINDAADPLFGAVALGTGKAHPGGYRMVQCNGNNQWVF